MNDQSSQTDSWKPSNFDLQLDEIQNSPLLNQYTSTSVIQTQDASAQTAENEYLGPNIRRIDFNVLQKELDIGSKNQLVDDSSVY